MSKPRLVPVRLAQAGLVLGLILLLAGCFAPLGQSSEGSLAINASLPGSIFTQATQTYVARVYVVSLTYEDLIRRYAAYDDFLTENDPPGSAWAAYYDELEEERDDLDIDLALKAAIDFGGNPYFDINVSADVGGGSDSGSFTITGVPAGRDYTVFIDIYNPGDEDDEDADSAAYSELFTSATVPYDEVFPTPGEVGIGAPLSTAISAFQAVLAEYTNTTKHPVVSVSVEEGETATIDLEIKEN